MVNSQSISNEEVKSWCENNNINISSFYRWKNYFNKTMNKLFDEVKVTTPNDMTIVINGITVSFSKELLPTIISSLK